mgnify:CR=1 FL=1
MKLPPPHLPAPPRLILGPSPAGAISMLWEQLHAQPRLWITRSQLRRRQLDDAEFGAVSTRFYSRHYTFAEYVREIHEGLPGRRPMIGRAEQLRLVQLLLEQQGRTIGSPFAEARRRHGLAPRVRQLIANFKQELGENLMTPEGDLEIDAAVRQAGAIIDRMTEVSDGLARRLREPVLSVFRQYLERLQTLGLIDDEDAFLVLEARLRARLARSPDGGMPRRFSGLVWEGWYLLNAVQRRLMRLLSAQAAQTWVLMECVPPPEPQPLSFEGAMAVHHDAVTFWRSLGAVVEHAPAAMEPTRAAVVASFAMGPRARRAAHASASSATGEPLAAQVIGNAPRWGRSDTKPLNLAAFDTPDAEIQAIASRVRLLLDAAAPESPAIGIVFPSLEREGDAMANALMRHGVPHRVINRRSVARTAPARMLRQLFDLLRRGWPRRETLSFFGAPLLSASPAMAGTARAVPAIEAAMREWRFGGARGAHAWAERAAHWTSKLQDRLDKCLKRRGPEIAQDDEAASGADSPPMDDPEKSALDAEIKAIEERLRLLRGPEFTGLVAMLADMERLTQLTDPIELATAWLRTLQAMQVQQALMPTPHDIERIPLAVIQQDIEGYHRVEGILAEIGRVMALHPPGGDDLHQQFVDEVLAAFDSEELSLRSQPRAGEVLVLSRLDIRHLQFDHLFMAGLTAPAVPGRQKVNIFFSEQERTMASLHRSDDQSESGWRTHQDTIHEWHHLLSVAMARHGRLHLSWSRQGRMRPSNFLEDLVRAAGGLGDQTLTDWATATADSHLAPLTTRDWCQQRALAPDAAHTWPAIARPSTDATHGPRDAFPAECPPIALTLPAVHPAHLALAMQVERLRRQHGYGHAFDGFIDLHPQNLPTQLAPQLERLTTALQRLSVTGLESYAHCPFRTLGNRLLMLKAERELTAMPGADEVGAVIHEALAHLFSDVIAHFRATKPDPSAAHQWWEAQGSRLGEQLARYLDEEIAERIDSDDVFWKGKRLRLQAGLTAGASTQDLSETDGIPPHAEGALATLMKHQPGLLKQGLMPAWVEAAIGTRPEGDAEPLHRRSVLVQMDGESKPLMVRGRIDRIDVFHHEDETYLVIIDYKSGKLPQRRDIDEGRSFQLTLYMKALQAIPSLRGHRPLSAVYMSVGGGKLELSGIGKELFASKRRSTKQAEEARATDPAPMAAEMAEMLEHSLRLAFEARRAAERGHFPTGWLGEARMKCAHCDFVRSCRVSHDAKARWRFEHPGERAGVGVYVADRLMARDAPSGDRR